MNTCYTPSSLTAVCSMGSNMGTRQQLDEEVKADAQLAELTRDVADLVVEMTGMPSPQHERLRAHPRRS